MTTPAEKEFILLVWADGTRRASVYNVLGQPLLGSSTNDVAIQFVTKEGKKLVISSNCKWILEEK